MSAKSPSDIFFSFIQSNNKQRTNVCRVAYAAISMHVVSTIFPLPGALNIPSVQPSIMYEYEFIVGMRSAPSMDLAYVRWKTWDASSSVFIKILCVHWICTAKLYLYLSIENKCQTFTLQRRTNNLNDIELFILCVWSDYCSLNAG